MIIGLASFVSPASFAAPAPPLSIAQQSAVPTETTDSEEDNNWRLNLDLYGFAPLSADTDVTLNGNSDTLSWDLRDVLDHLTGLMTVRAGLEKGRWGLQTALNYSRFAGDFGGSSWTSLDRSRNRKLTGNEVSRELTLQGDVVKLNLDALIADIVSCAVSSGGHYCTRRNISNRVDAR